MPMILAGWEGWERSMAQDPIEDASFFLSFKEKNK